MSINSKMGLFQSKLKSEMNEKRFSASDLALWGDLSLAEVRRLLSGRALPSPETLRKIRRTLGVPRHEIEWRVQADEFFRASSQKRVKKKRNRGLSKKIEQLTKDK